MKSKLTIISRNVLFSLEQNFSLTNPKYSYNSESEKAFHWWKLGKRKVVYEK